MQGGKNWILLKDMNANRVLLRLSLAGNLVNPLSSMGPKGGSVTMDSVLYIALLWFNNLLKYSMLI